MCMCSLRLIGLFTDRDLLQLPGPFPITNVDLAEFTLGALRTVKIYNSCPYVVQDGV